MSTAGIGYLNVMKQQRVLKIKKSYQGLYAAVAVLLLAALIIFLITGVNFFRITNLLNVARSFSMLGIAAIGQTLTIIVGGLDLSIGEVISTANVFSATFMDGKDVLFVPVALLTLLMGAVIGLFNGLLITKRNVPPFIATLGMSIVLRGARLVWTQGLPQGKIPDVLVRLGIGSSLGIPNLFYMLIIVVIVTSILLRKTGFGRRLYAVGTNPNVATLSGIKTDRIKITAYVLCSVSGALVGILLGGYTGMSDQFIGAGYDIDTIAAAVLGGAAIGGGFGSVRGTVIGVFIMLIITNISLLVHFPIQSQMMIKGVLIIFALWMGARKQ